MHNRNFESTYELVSELLAEPESGALQCDDSPNASISPTSQELKDLIDSKMCKRCHNNEACMVFMPCGHLVCCYKCKDGWQSCPVCHSFIRDMIRSYLA